jgi:hypothetical protein
MMVTRRITFVVSGLIAAVILCRTTTSQAATKTVTFDWEDGVSTSYGWFAGHGGSAILSNVTSGGDLDYTPDAANPAAYTVAPFGGDHMLEMYESPLSDAPGSMYGILAAIENLDAGDTVNYSFYAYIPSVPSPSGAMYVAPNAHLAMSGIAASPPGMGDAFKGGLGQQPKPTVGGGWVRLAYDGNFMGGGPEDPLVFDPSLSFDPANADSLYVRVRGVNPLAMSGFPTTDVDQNFYVDDFTVTVASNNPEAVIILPDGSVTSVPEPSTILCVLMAVSIALATGRTSRRAIRSVA